MDQAEAPGTVLPGNAGAIEVLAKFFRALGDPSRLRLLEFLLHEEHSAGECVTHVGLSQGRVSSHLACLANCGFVSVRRQGRFAYFKVTDPRVAELVTLARNVAAANAAEVAACLRVDGV